MKDPGSEDPHDAGVERVLAQVGRPGAAPEFKARLRERFLADAAPERAGGPRVIEDLPAPERTRAFPFVWPFVLAASVAAILWIVLARDAHPRWRVLEAKDDYVVDSLKIPASDAARLAEVLQTAHDIQTFDAPLRLQLRDDLVLELGPHSRVSQMSFPASGAMYSLYANAGALHVCTGPGFDGGRLRVLTDNMESTVVGTTFGIDVLDTGTCLCCLEGTVRCDPHDAGGTKPVEGGKRCFAHRDGTKSDWSAGYPPHLEPLEVLRAWAAANWKK